MQKLSWSIMGYCQICSKSNQVGTHVKRQQNSEELKFTFIPFWKYHSAENDAITTQDT